MQGAGRGSRCRKAEEAATAARAALAGRTGGEGRAEHGDAPGGRHRPQRRDGGAVPAPAVPAGPAARRFFFLAYGLAPRREVRPVEQATCKCKAEAPANDEAAAKKAAAAKAVQGHAKKPKALPRPRCCCRPAPSTSIGAPQCARRMLDPISPAGIIRRGFS